MLEIHYDEGTLAFDGFCAMEDGSMYVDSIYHEGDGLEIYYGKVNDDIVLPELYQPLGRIHADINKLIAEAKQVIEDYNKIYKCNCFNQH